MVGGSAREWQRGAINGVITNAGTLTGSLQICLFDSITQTYVHVPSMKAITLHADNRSQFYFQ